MNTRSFLALLLSLLLVLSCVAAACGGGASSDDGGGDDNEFRSAVPNVEAMKLTVPDDQGTGALALGTRAELYTITRNVSAVVNTYAGLVLITLQLTALQPPSERGADYRVWGPTEPKGLEALSWRLRVDKESDSLFAFSADARPKTSQSDGDFLAMISGSITPGSAPGKSSGTMTLNFDNYQSVGGPDPCPAGLIHVDWDASSSETRTVTVRWEGFQNTCKGTELNDVTYQYSQNSDFSGEFLYQAVDNIHLPRANKPELEIFAAKSRWQSDGTGRSDVALTGDEIEADLQALGLSATQVQVTQCWDSAFNLTFSDSEPTEFEQYLFEELGSESDCAFPTAEYPSF